ncbi:hypothetical protein HDV04_004382, partial [Boothiomyces sp. JEL0838]
MNPNPAPSIGPSGGSCGGLFAQCGGSGFTGQKCCKAGLKCNVYNPWYSQCIQDSSNPGGIPVVHTTNHAPEPTIPVITKNPPAVTSVPNPIP